MKKKIMKRAWEIYRTLEGDRIAKLSMAMRMAWAEINAIIETGKKAYGCAWQFQSVEEYVEDGLRINRKEEIRRAEREALIESAMEEMKGMTDIDADEFSFNAAKEAKRSGNAAMSTAYRAAYRRMFAPERAYLTIGIYVNA